LIACVRCRIERLAHAKHHRGALNLLALHGHEAHRGPQGGLADGFCVGGIILLALDEGLHIGRRDQPHVMAQTGQFATPKVGPAASFHCD
jgi:hypothetical protein